MNIQKWFEFRTQGEMILRRNIFNTTRFTKLSVYKDLW